MALGWTAVLSAGIAAPEDGRGLLTRIDVGGDASYTLRTVPEAPVQRVSLFVLSRDENGAEVEIPLLYGVSPKDDFRWEYLDGEVFLSQCLANAGLVTASVSRPPVSEALRRVRSGTPPSDVWNYLQHGASFTYCSMTPLKRALEGWIKLTQDGVEEVVPRERPAVQYDFRVVGGSNIELFMTLDGRLAKWFFNGKEWNHQRNYGFSIAGKFLVCQDGESLVSAREGSWYLIRDIDANPPTMQAITQCAADRPLVLIEDLVARRTYFEHAGDVFDGKGVKVWSVPRTLGSNERSRALVDFVYSQRGE